MASFCCCVKIVLSIFSTQWCIIKIIFQPRCNQLFDNGRESSNSSCGRTYFLVIYYLFSEGAVTGGDSPCALIQDRFNAEDSEGFE